MGICSSKDPLQEEAERRVQNFKLNPNRKLKYIENHRRERSSEKLVDQQNFGKSQEHQAENIKLIEFKPIKKHEDRNLDIIHPYHNIKNKNQNQTKPKLKTVTEDYSNEFSSMMNNELNKMLLEENSNSKLDNIGIRVSNFSKTDKKGKNI